MPEPIPEFDLYAELEVSERASVETIEAAWRSLAKRNHPDVAANHADAARRMARLNVARDWLTDSEQRRRYDASRKPSADSGPTRKPAADEATGRAQPSRPAPTQPRPESATWVAWRLPPLDLLDPTSRTPGPSEAVHARNEQIIVLKLASFGIDARVVGRHVGPTFTQYEVQPAPPIAPKQSRVPSHTLRDLVYSGAIPRVWSLRSRAKRGGNGRTTLADA